MRFVEKAINGLATGGGVLGAIVMSIVMIIVVAGVIARAFNHVLAGILRCRSMGGFKNRVPGHIIDIGTGCNTDPANDRCQCIGNVIAVKVQCGDHRVFCWTGQDLLQKCIGNHIFDDDPAGAGS